jgi:hypothetical protein
MVTDHPQVPSARQLVWGKSGQRAFFLKGETRMNADQAVWWFTKRATIIIAAVVTAQLFVVWLA